MSGRRRGGLGSLHAMTDAIVLEQVEVCVARAGQILGPVSWNVGAGERWAVLGPNGGGKTTLLSVAGAWRQPTAGRAVILGSELGHVDVRRLRLRIGHVGHTVTEKLRPQLLVRDVVLTGRSSTLETWFQGFSADERREAEASLEQVGCGALADRALGTCSQGERARVLLARASYARHELLLLDEPAAGLDLPGREQLVMAMERGAETGRLGDHGAGDPSSRGAALRHDACRAAARGSDRGGRTRRGDAHRRTAFTGLRDDDQRGASPRPVDRVRPRAVKRAAPAPPMIRSNVVRPAERCPLLHEGCRALRVRRGAVRDVRRHSGVAVPAGAANRRAAGRALPWLAETIGLERLSNTWSVAIGVLVVVFCVGGFLLVLREAWRGNLSAKTVVVLAVVYHVVVLALPLLFSRDVYSYSFYGRIAAIYHANPYVRTPVEFARDPLWPLVGPKWVDTPAVYGPLWTQISAAMAHLIHAPAGMVKAYRWVAVAASLATIAVIYDTTKRVWPARTAFAVAAFGLNPVTVFHSVASGHNDLLVALARRARSRSCCAASELPADRGALRSEPW